MAGTVTQLTGDDKFDTSGFCDIMNEYLRDHGRAAITEKIPPIVTLIAFIFIALIDMYVD